jgi:hypothetical protein
MTAKVHVLRIAVVAASAPFGIVTLAICLSGAAIVEMGIVTAEIRRTLGIQLKTIGSIYAQSGALAVWSSLPSVALVVTDHMTELHLGGLLALAMASVAFWLLGILLLRHPLKSEIGVVAAKIRSFFRPR